MVGRGQSRECADHCIVYNRKCFVIKLANWIRPISENGLWPEGMIWFSYQEHYRETVDRVHIYPQIPRRCSMKEDRIMDKTLSRFSFICAMVIVNVYKPGICNAIILLRKSCLKKKKHSESVFT